MRKKEIAFIEYLNSLSKMLKITSEYLNDLSELEEKDKKKFEDFNELMKTPEKFFELVAKKSPKLSKTVIELFVLFASLSDLKNPMELTVKEKKEQAKKLKETSEKINTLSKKLKTLVKKKEKK